jgi:WD40 repeat protein
MRLSAIGVLSLCALRALCGEASAAEPTYWQDVRPVLRKHCTVCHRESKLKEPEISAGLALDSPQGVLRGGKAPVVKPGKPAESLLVELITTNDPKRRMPLDGDPLPPEAVDLIRRWIAAGAPEGAKPADDGAAQTEGINPSARRVRKLPVTFATRAALPKGGTLSLSLPVGPLPPVAAVVFSPDGNLLAVGSYGRVTVWDLTAARPAKVLTQVLGAVNDVKFSPDGKLLAVTGGQPSARGDLRLFDTADWKLAASLGGHLDTVSCVSFSPDGTKLASASFDKTVRLWDVKSGKVLHAFTGHSDFVYAVAFSPKGDWYATASKDRTGRVVDAGTGQGKLTFSGMDNEVLAVAVRPDGGQVVTAGFEPQLVWWDAATGERARRQAGHNVAVHELTFAAGGQLAASAGGDKTVRLWNPQTGAQVRSLAAESAAFAVALDSAGKRAAAGCADGLVRVWETEGGRQLLTLWGGPGDGELGRWLALTPDGYFAASDGLVGPGSWRAGGAAADSQVAALNDPKLVAKAARGEKLPEFK